jgi:hypothetical protein
LHTTYSVYCLKWQDAIDRSEIRSASKFPLCYASMRSYARSIATSIRNLGPAAQKIRVPLISMTYLIRNRCG